MQTNISKNLKKKGFSNSLKSEKENITCKDGFCTLLTQNKNSSIQKNKVDLFDPI